MHPTGHVDYSIIQVLRWENVTTFVGEPLLLTRIQLGGFAGKTGPSEALQFVGEGRFDRLTPIPKPSAFDKLVEPFEEVAIEGQGNFGLRHNGMTNHHTTCDAG